MRTINPITPQEVNSKRLEDIPDLVIEAFNELIVKNSQGATARINQDDAIERIMTKIDISRGDIFAKGYLNVEPIYEAAGWAVSYDKPGYNESYEAHFIFSRK